MTFKITENDIGRLALMRDGSYAKIKQFDDEYYEHDDVDYPVLIIPFWENEWDDDAMYYEEVTVNGKYWKDGTDSYFDLIDWVD